jgi:predicted acylesterase/phospholipase RssA
MSETNSRSEGKEWTPQQLLNEVRGDEFRVISERRKVMNAGDPADPESLIGLAFSGGGIRSAAFNLGVLQSFFIRGLLRHVDYLSTVSGGSYIGSWFSSLLRQNDCGALSRGNKFLRQRLTGQDGKQPPEVIRLARNGKYLDRMDKVWNHFSIGLIYNNLALLSVLVFVCLAVAYCWRAMDEEPVVRWLYNGAHYTLVPVGPDEPDPRTGFNMNYILKETVRPFLPAVVLGLLWFLVWSLPYVWALFRTALPRRGAGQGAAAAFFLVAPVSLVATGLLAVALVATLLVSLGLFVLLLLTDTWAGVLVALFWIVLAGVLIPQLARKKTWRGRLARVSDVLFVLAVAALAVGVTVYLAIPVQNMAPPGTRPTTVEQSSGWTQKVVYPLLGILLTALTPFLRPKRLLQSGLNPKSALEGWVFTVATSALLCGVPLALVWLFARHNFAARFALPATGSFWTANHPPDRKQRLEGGDLLDLNDFKKKLAAEKGIWDPGAFIRKRIQDQQNLPVLAAWWKREAEEMDQKDECGEDVAVVWPGWRLVRFVSRASEAVRKDLAQVLSDNVLADAGFTWRMWDKGTQGETKPEDFDKGALYRSVLSGHPSADQIAQMMTLAKAREFNATSPELNRLLFEAYYGRIVFRQDQILRPNVIDRDQAWRRFWILATGLLALGGCLFVNLNATSMHNFYRERLAETFIRREQDAPGPLLLKDLTSNTAVRGGPYLLISATVNHHPTEPAPSKQDPENLGQTGTEGFLLSPLYCGASSSNLDYEPTETYWGGRLRLSDAMTISGAAVSPFQVTSWFILVLMVLANARTGQWVPRPCGMKGRQDDFGEWLAALLAGTFGPTFLGLALGEVLHLIPYVSGGKGEADAGPRRAALAEEKGPGGPDAKKKTRPRPLYFLTDGGHHENLGLWPLLERRCRLIFVSDASEDGTSGFADLLRVIRRARFERGIQITGDLSSADDSEHDRTAFLKGMELPTELPPEYKDPLADLLELLRSWDEPTNEQLKRQDADGNLPPGYRRSNRHFFLSKIKYPDVPEPAYLIYLKPTLTGDEAADLQGYASQNRGFPHHPTADQLYDEDRFESYRQLGEHIGARLCEEFENCKLLHTLWDCSTILPVHADATLNRLLEQQNAALEQLVAEKARRNGQSKPAEPVPAAGRR